MSRNFTTDVDTQREYFNATYFNNSGQNQIARYDTTLLKPFFPNPDQWKLAINRMRVPLSGIPLTRNNIPFEQWQVGIEFNNSTVVGNALEFVPQFNQKTAITNKTYNVNGQQIQRVNNDLQLSEILESGNIQNASSLKPAYDLQFGEVVYVVNTNLTQVDVYNIKNFTYITSLSAPASRVITCITSEPTTGKFFMAYADGVGENVYIQQYEHTAYATFTTSNLYSTNTLRPGSIYSMTFYSSKIYAIYQPIDGGTSPVAYLSVYQEGVGLPLVNNNWDYENSYITHNAVNNIIFVSVIAPNPIGQRILAYNPSAGPSYITNVGNFFSGITLSATNPFVGFDINNNIIIDSGSGIQVRGYTLPSSMPYLYGISFTNGSKLIFETIPALGPVDSGPYDIFTYQDFLNKINEAFLASFNTLKTQFGAQFLPTQPPQIIFNAETKLFSIVLEGQYLQTNPDGSKQYAILFNQTLWNKFYFPCNNGTGFLSEFKSIILQNYGINAIQGTGSSTLPQFFFVQQEDSTIYAFYDLVRIIVGTTLIPVSGDGEGKTFSNTGFSSNNAINMITDIVPDTTTLTPGSVIIYIPAGILRWYNLYAQQPFQRVDLILYYETKDGNVYPINIVNGEFFSVKLEFKKGPGDF